MGVRLSTTSILTSTLVGMVGSEIHVYDMAFPVCFPIYKRSSCRQYRLCLILKMTDDFALGKISVYEYDIYVLGTI